MTQPKMNLHGYQYAPQEKKITSVTRIFAGNGFASTTTEIRTANYSAW